MFPATVYDLGQARLAGLRRQAQHDALARDARRARGHHHGHRAPGVPAVLARWARRPWKGSGT
jgi:hypothetical protein